MIMQVSERVRTIAAKSVLSLGLATAAGGLIFTGAQASTEFSEAEQQRSLYGCGVALGGLLLVGTGVALYPPRVQLTTVENPSSGEPELPPEADIVLGPDPDGTQPEQPIVSLSKKQTPDQGEK